MARAKSRYDKGAPTFRPVLFRRAKVVPIAIVLLLVMIMVLLVSCSLSSAQVCSHKSCFDVELAVSPEKRNLGLMHRSELADDAGMLFIFPEEGNYSFWMKNTLIPLDIIWFDSGQRVVHVETAYPCEDRCPPISPDAEAMYVLEINAGSADENDIRIGTILEFRDIS